MLVLHKFVDQNCEPAEKVVVQKMKVSWSHIGSQLLSVVFHPSSSSSTDRSEPLLMDSCAFFLSVCILCSLFYIKVMSTVVAAEKVGPVVIGAGVVGLAVARALTAKLTEQQQDPVLILERNVHFGSETSARNSEVVHGGLYYPTSSLKARFCVQGRQKLYDFCDEHYVAYDKMGKLIVATAPAQRDSTLRQLHEQAAANGYTTTRLLTADDVRSLEPSVHCFGALWSPETGIVDSHAFMTMLLGQAEEQGATLAVQSAVENANITLDGAVQLCVEETWIESTCVVNCAGLWADRVARWMHDNKESSSRSSSSPWSPPRQYFCRGNYFRLQGVSPAPFSHLIYPVPDSRGGLGVHATLDISRQVKFGPDVEWLEADTTDPDHLSYVPNADRMASFYDSIRQYWPDLRDDALQPDYAGVRPKLSHPSQLAAGQQQPLPFQDFLIAGPKEHGIPGLVHLLGIESPGLTSSLAIADYVVDLVLTNK